jgi:hypothetical protein
LLGYVDGAVKPPAFVQAFWQGVSFDFHGLSFSICDGQVGL